MNALVSHRKGKRARVGLMIKGAATITLDQRVPKHHRDDLTQLRKDWEKIGSDLQKAVPKAKRERAAV